MAFLSNLSIPQQTPAVNSKGPTQQTFSLAGIVFDPRLFEVPQDLEYGLETWGSIHRIPQNSSSQPKQIAQTFGVFPRAITWEGRFLGGADDGTAAQAKADRLMALQASQQVVPLVLGKQAWDVIVWDFRVTQRSRWDLGYRIEVRPLVDRSGRVSSALPASTAADNLKTQSTAMQALRADARAADARAAAANAQFDQTLAAIAAAQPELSQSTSTLLSLITSVTGTQATYAKLGGTVVNSSATADTNLYVWTGLVSAALASYGQTLQTAAGTDQSVAVSVNSGNAFALAANYLGDWTRFGDVMTVNGLTDPFITAPTKVAIPRT